MECVKRNIGYLCSKDERQPRAKKAKTDHNDKDQKKTWVLLHHLSFWTQVNAEWLICYYVISNAILSQHVEAEEAIHLLEHFADETSRGDAYPSGVLEPTAASVGLDYPNVYWSAHESSQRHNDKTAVIRGIVDAVPELDMIRHLNEVFVTRCQGPLGNVVHESTFLEQAEVFCGCLGLASPELRVVALSSTFSMDALACHLLAVRIPHTLVNELELTSPFLTVCARSRLSSCTLCSWLVSYTSGSLR